MKINYENKFKIKQMLNDKIAKKKMLKKIRKRQKKKNNHPFSFLVHIIVKEINLLPSSFKYIR
jgi:hypothetical protein